MKYLIVMFSLLLVSNVALASKTPITCVTLDKGVQYCIDSRDDRKFLVIEVIKT